MKRGEPGGTLSVLALTEFPLLIQSRFIQDRALVIVPLYMIRIFVMRRFIVSIAWGEAVESDFDGIFRFLKRAAP
ncbi:MAG: hypothetical protein LBQ62_00500 [Candidatus Accumulibacter sp.]|nr:hypothetical protein [Accumulibacter sp.]